MFFVPGSTNVVRINGAAKITLDADLLAFFGRGEVLPRTVIVIRADEVYFQCARAILRSRLWSGADESAGIPSAGDMLRDATEGAVDAAAYDAAWPGRVAGSMW